VGAGGGVELSPWRTVAWRPQANAAEAASEEEFFASSCHPGSSPVLPVQVDEAKAVASAHLLQLVKGEAPFTPGPKPTAERAFPPVSPPTWSPTVAKHTPHGSGGNGRMPVAPATPPPPFARGMQTPSPPAASPDWSGRGRRPDSAASAAAAAALSTMDSGPQPLPPLPGRSSPLAGSPGEAKGSGKSETRSRIRAQAAAARAGKEAESSGAASDGSASESGENEKEANSLGGSPAASQQRRKRGGTRRRGARAAPRGKGGSSEHQSSPG